MNKKKQRNNKGCFLAGHAPAYPPNENIGYTEKLKELMKKRKGGLS